MVQNVHTPPGENEATDPPLKWWWYLLVLLSLGFLVSRVGQRKLAQAMREKARRGQSGETASPLTITADSRGITVNPARLEWWALWGFVIGALNGVLTSTPEFGHPRRMLDHHRGGGDGCRRIGSRSLLGGRLGLGGKNAMMRREAPN